MTLAEFITDWIPPIGIAGAGIFALWRWGFNEWLRRQREIPSIDTGSMAAKGFPINQSKVFVQLDTTWGNPGRVPFMVDTELTKVDVFEVFDSLPIGPLKTRKGDSTDLSEPKHSHNPFSGSPSLKFAPGTESVIQCHFILPAEQIVLFRWKLFRENPKQKGLTCTRFLLLLVE